MVADKKSILSVVRYFDLEKWSVDTSNAHSFFSSTKTKKLSNIMQRIKEAIVIDDITEYQRITVKLYGNGVVERDKTYGKDIGTKRQFKAKAGQLIISRIDARNGAIGVVPDELDGAIVTNDFWLFDVHEADVDFLILILSSPRFQTYWQTKSNGTTNRQRVDEEDFLSCKIPFFDIQIQKKIVKRYNDTISQAEAYENEAARLESSIISHLNKALEIETASIDKIQRFSVSRFSILENWCTPFDRKGNNKSAKFPIHPLSSICKVNSGGTPSRNSPAYYMGEIPWVKTGEVKDDYIFDTEEKITPEAIRDSSAKLYPKGSIIVAMYGHTRGKTAKLAIDSTTNQACAVLHSIDNKKVLTDFLWIYLQGERENLRSLAVGSAQPNLNAIMIKAYPVVVPPLDIQQKIVDEIFSIKKQIKICRLNATLLRDNAKKEFEEYVFNLSVMEDHI